MTHALLEITRPQADAAPARGVAMEDWGDLFSAAMARLHRTVDERTGDCRDFPPHEAVRHMRGSVLECVEVLNQLQTTAAQEFARRGRLERQIADALAALERARTELAGTRAGERRARHLALHDDLTALPNRGYFRARLDHALAHPLPQRRAMAVLYLDLDGFKPINDVHGHAAGDELLKIVATRLARSVRTGDMVSRLGGDEFGCMLSDLVEREQVGQVARKLFGAVSAPLKIGAIVVTVRPSIGIAICPHDGATAEDLLNSADGAMYSAKRQRTGYAFCARRCGA